MIVKKGFTLAEVLITVGIIGVIALLITPTLSNNIQGSQYRSKYQRVLDALGNAVSTNIMIDNYDFSQTETGGSSKGDMSIYNILKNRLNVRTVGADVGWQDESGKIKFGNLNSDNYTLYFDVGAFISFPKTDKGCLIDQPCKAVIDLNGRSGPNKLVECSDGTGSDCKVNVANDIFPIKLYEDTAVPNSEAARASLYNKKKKEKN